VPLKGVKPVIDSSRGSASHQLLVVMIVLVAENEHMQEQKLKNAQGKALRIKNAALLVAKQISNIFQRVKKRACIFINI